MKKVKIAFWIIVLGFIGLVVFQNWGYFNARQMLQVNLRIYDFAFPEFPNYFFFLLCFLVGLLLAYTYGLIERFRSGKLIKKLNAATEAQQEEISVLKRELEMLQRTSAESSSNAAPMEAAVDTDPAIEI